MEEYNLPAIWDYLVEHPDTPWKEIRLLFWPDRTMNQLLLTMQDAGYLLGLSDDNRLCAVVHVDAGVNKELRGLLGLSRHSHHNDASKPARSDVERVCTQYANNYNGVMPPIKWVLSALRSEGFSIKDSEERSWEALAGCSSAELAKNIGATLVHRECRERAKQTVRKFQEWLGRSA